MKQPSILIVILNWRQPELTIACVKAVQAMDGPQFDLLLIDNGSGDNSAEILTDKLPDVQLLTLPENLGFAGGCNVGLRHAVEQGYTYALLLNNDAFPEVNMLQVLLGEMGGDVGMASPKVLYHPERDYVSFGGGRQHPSLLEVRDSKANQKDRPAWQETEAVDYLWGTCWLVNLAALQTVGLLDERFFMYYEDLDWSIRFRQAGYRLLWVGKARLYHQESRSTGGTDSPLRRYYLARSSVIFFRRYAHQGRPLFIFFFRLGSAIKMVSRLLLKGRRASAGAYLRGLRDGWKLASGREYNDAKR
ncbi:MAG: glycosyltransferase family 2 protein [Candidatus Promineifilaceae bacterium]